MKFETPEELKALEERIRNLREDGEFQERIQKIIKNSKRALELLAKGPDEKK